MEVTINGESRTLDAGTTLRELVQALGLNPDGVAVAVNMAVVPRAEHEGYELAEGDAVEIIRAVGGG